MKNHSLQRLQSLDFQLASSVAKTQPVKGKFTNCWEFLRMNDFLTEKGRTFKDQVGQLMQSVYPKVDKIKELQVNGLDCKGYGSPELSILDTCAVFYELARWDASIATFMIVHNSLGISVVDRLGNEEQKRRILPDTILLKKILCFGLTEPTNGSDATGLISTAKKVEGGFILNGKKRWIGNAGFADYIIYWAKNIDEGNKIQGFIVEKGSKGLSTNKIEGKYSLRMVQNFDIEVKDVFVPDNNRLAKALDFASGANNILKHSRLFVAWIAVGIAAGAYEAAHKFAIERVQFGKPIGGFQLIQEKLVRMQSMIQSMLLLCHRVSVLYQQDKASMAIIAMTKAHCSKLGREVCQMAREIQGGDGILIKNHAMKALLDAEGIYTYEGTYEINTLVAGREILGLSAVK